MPFRNPIIGGRSILIREAIKSPNYVPGVAGWTINRDGSAEFSNVTIRGATITAEEIDMRLDNPFTEAMFVAVLNDPNARWRLRADGHMEWGNGTDPRDTQFERVSPGVMLLSNSLQLLGGLEVNEGANARMGVATLAAGTVVVANTSVTANTRIFLTCQTPGGTPGFLRVSARTPATSFTILSSNAADTSVVAWLMVEPA